MRNLRYHPSLSNAPPKLAFMHLEMLLSIPNFQDEQQKKKSDASHSKQQ